MVTPKINIPFRLIREAANSGKVKHLRLLLLMKHGGRIRLDRREILKLSASLGYSDRHTRKLLNEMITLGWIGRNKNKIYIRSWEYFNQKHGKWLAVKFDTSWIFNDFETRIYWIAIAFHLRLYVDSQTLHKERKRMRKRGLPTLQFTEHQGGIALSVIAKFFNKSAVWASLMRKKCSDLGLLSFTRRFVESDIGERTLNFLDTGTTGAFFYGKDGKVYREITSKCEVLSNVCWKW